MDDDDVEIEDEMSEFNVEVPNSRFWGFDG